MPAKNPRISVTVKPETDALLRRLSALSGDSTSAIVGQILEQSQPVLERLVQVLEAAERAKEHLTAQHAQSLKDAEAQVLEHLGLSMDLFDEASKSIIEEAEAITRKQRKKGATATRQDEALASPAVAAARQPPHVTRGSGTPKPQKNNKQTTRATGSKTASKASKTKGRG